MTRRSWVRRLAWAITFVALTAALAAALFWQETRIFVRQYEEFFKLAGYVLGPLLAVAGFLWGLSEKAELRDQSEELGVARERAEQEAAKANVAFAESKANLERIKILEKDLATIADSRRLWKLRPNAPFPDYKGWKYDTEGARVVAVSLFKGGVGKTHLTANFAAYVSEKQQKPVLIIDLDYQGSLSTLLLNAARIDAPGSSVDAFFGEDVGLATLMAKRLHLSSRGNGVALNRGRGLPQAWLVPADYTLTEVESQLLIDRTINPRAALDERYRLAHVLLNPDVRRDYALILIDTPPRMTLGTVNAFVASHAYIVPTILDRVSSEAVRPFLEQMEGPNGIKQDLDLNLTFAGMVATLTRNLPLDPVERQVRAEITATAKEFFGPTAAPFVSQNIPKKKPISDSDDLGYFVNSDGPLAAQFYDAVFDELWARIHGLHTNSTESP